VYNIVKIAELNIKESMIEASKKYAKGSLIDIGCGTKPYKNIFKDYVDSHFGIEEPIQNEAHYKEKTEVDLYCNFLDLDKSYDNKYDTLLCNQVLEHVLETNKFISKCHNILKKDGYGIFTVPMTWKLHAEPYDYYRFTKYSLEKLFKENGFTITEIKPLEGSLATTSQLIILYLCDLKINNIFFKAFRRFMFYALDFIALKLDKKFFVDNICITYLLVVKK